MIKHQKEMQRIGNLVFNKSGNRDDENAWLTLKEFFCDLEKENERLKIHCERIKNLLMQSSCCYHDGSDLYKKWQNEKESLCSSSDNLEDRK